MIEFSAIGREVEHMEDKDTMVAIRLVQEGREGEMVVPRLERGRLLLERGAGYDVDSGCNGRRSAEGRAVAFANRVNALALAMTQLPQFKERQDEVFTLPVCQLPFLVPHGMDHTVMGMVPVGEQTRLLLLCSHVLFSS